MAEKKQRVPIPPSIAGLVMFLSDRTCCVCRNANAKRLQIHHIDDDPANNALENLAPLCLDCHDETQIRGGFGRRLDSEQVRLYRIDWLRIISERRTAVNVTMSGTGDSEHDNLRIKMAVAQAEAYRENKQWALLATHYARLGHAELQAQYTERAIAEGLPDSTHIFLRGLQNRIDLIPSEVIQREIKRKTDSANWSQLGRLYRTLRMFPESVRATCQSIIESIDDGRPFSAAYYLKEMEKKKDYEELFKMELDSFTQSEDLWWAYRCLQELGWTSERQKFLLEHRDAIEQGGRPMMKADLQAVLGDYEGSLKTREEIARNTFHSAHSRPMVEEPKPELDPNNSSGQPRVNGCER